MTTLRAILLLVPVSLAAGACGSSVSGTDRSGELLFLEGGEEPELPDAGPPPGAEPEPMGGGEPPGLSSGPR